MPLRNFIGPIGPDGERQLVRPEDAPEFFDSEGICPADVILTILKDKEERQNGAHTLISPSKADPDSNCRRQILIERWLPYDLEPTAMWDALEGTLFHRQLVAAAGGETEEAWRELRLPLRGKPVEVLPGIEMMGVVDHLRKDFSELRDYKTTRYPKTSWKKLKDGEKEAPPWTPPLETLQANNRVQVNLYDLLVEREFGRRVDRLWVWRAFRGSHQREHTFRKIPIPRMEPGALLDHIALFAESLLKWDTLAFAAKASQQPQAVEELLKGVPMDGYDKQMFGGQKCSRYCSVKDVCFKLAGISEW